MEAHAEGCCSHQVALHVPIITSTPLSARNEERMSLSRPACAHRVSVRERQATAGQAKPGQLASERAGVRAHSQLER